MIMWQGAIGEPGDPRTPTVETDGNYNQSCTVVVHGCVGLYVAYPSDGGVGLPTMYVDYMIASAPGYVPDQPSCCVFRRVVSISDVTDKMESLTGYEWQFGPVQWLRSRTVTYNAGNPTTDPSELPYAGRRRAIRRFVGAWRKGRQ